MHKNKTLPEKRRNQASEDQSDLERRAVSWLKSQFGYKCKEGDSAKGRVSKKPYEVDIHCTKEEFFGILKTHLWVDLENRQIKQTDVKSFVEAARDVREAHNDNIEKWPPKMLMFISKRGFDKEAVDLANRYRIYLVLAAERFEFVGKMNREYLKEKEDSEY